MVVEVFDSLYRPRGLQVILLSFNDILKHCRAVAYLAFLDTLFGKGVSNESALWDSRIGFLGA